MNKENPSNELMGEQIHENRVTNVLNPKRMKGMNERMRENRDDDDDDPCCMMTTTVAGRPTG